MALPKPRRLGNNYKCSVVESSMELDFDLIIPDKDKRPGVAAEADKPIKENQEGKEPGQRHMKGGE